MAAISVDGQPRPHKNASKSAPSKRKGRPPKDPTERISVHKLQLTVPAPVFDRMTKIKKRTGALSYQEVVRAALRLYDALTEELEMGKKVIIENPNDPNLRIMLHL
jgi:hypothetical protein